MPTIEMKGDLAAPSSSFDRRDEARLRDVAYYRGESSSSEKDPSPYPSGSSRGPLPAEGTGVVRRTVLSYFFRRRRRLLFVSVRKNLESIKEAWGYIWLVWRKYAGLEEGYWYALWYCIPLCSALFLLYPVSKILGMSLRKWILFSVECHVVALPIMRAIYHGLARQARDGMRYVYEICWPGIRLLRAIVQGIRLDMSKELLLFLGEGYEFEKQKLIQLWMAEGFLETEPMELYGSHYFDKLISKGYILHSNPRLLHQVNTEKFNSDLGEKRDKFCYLRLDEFTAKGSETATEEIVHVSVAGSDINDDIFKTLGKFKRLRTLLFYGSKIEHVPVNLFLSFESLTVLDLSRSDIKELPISALKMIHLHYLDVSWTSIELLPERIGRLQKLQTLKLIGCSHLWRLPREMQGLTQLRHLDFDVLGHLAAMPKGMGDLVNLRTLSAFIIGTQERGKIGELGGLNNLMGEFCIAKLEYVQGEHDAKMAALTSKHDLKKLELRWSDFPLRAIKNQNLDGTVLTHLCPHPDLEELVIRCYGGTHLPSWIGGQSFHKLSSITLFKCENVLILPYIQMLPSLEYLGLISMNSVTLIDFRGENEIDAAFPKLQRLVIDEMLNLNTWLDVFNLDFLCLTELTIKHCSILPELPSLVYLSTLKRLEISNCPKVQLGGDKELSASVELLIVENCPLISKSCLKQEGNTCAWNNKEANLDLMDDDDTDSEKVNGESDDDGAGEILPLIDDSSLKEKVYVWIDDDDSESDKVDAESENDGDSEILPWMSDSCLEEGSNGDQGAILDPMNAVNELPDKDTRERHDDGPVKLFPDDYDNAQVVSKPESKKSEDHNETSWYEVFSEQVWNFFCETSTFDTVRKPKSNVTSWDDNDFCYQRSGEEIWGFLRLVEFS